MLIQLSAGGMVRPDANTWLYALVTLDWGFSSVINY